MKFITSCINYITFMNNNYNNSVHCVLNFMLFFNHLLLFTFDTIWCNVRTLFKIKICSKTYTIQYFSLMQELHMCMAIIFII